MRGATGGDKQLFQKMLISIHTPHAGSDVLGLRAGMMILIFQSTLPMRGATSLLYAQALVYANFNPHSPCGERLTERLQGIFFYIISIHTPHAGSDLSGSISSANWTKFQSTLPMRGATEIACGEPIFADISIHTPHAGSDSHKMHISNHLQISIHTPHAGSDFLENAVCCRPCISIHTPHAGSDMLRCWGTSF